MTLFEWPPLSGRIANYSEDELQYIREFFRQKERGEITEGECSRQIGHCHDLKVEFGVHLIKNDIGKKPDTPPEPQQQALATEAHARGTDPWTSHAAADSLSEEKLRDTQAAVLACFKEFGSMHHEKLVDVYAYNFVARSWPLQSVSGLRTRTSELVDGNLLRNSGNTVKLSSGRSSIVWAVA